jgi:hypothetical protein
MMKPAAILNQYLVGTIINPAGHSASQVLIKIYRWKKYRIPAMETV